MFPILLKFFLQKIQKFHLCKNYIFGVMTTNWSVKRIASALNVSKVMAKMYFQPCHNPEQVLETLARIAALDCSVG